MAPIVNPESVVTANYWRERLNDLGIALELTETKWIADLQLLQNENTFGYSPGKLPPEIHGSAFAFYHLMQSHHQLNAIELAGLRIFLGITPSQIVEYENRLATIPAA